MKEYKQKSSVELLVYFLIDPKTFKQEYKENSSVELLVELLTDIIHF